MVRGVGGVLGPDLSNLARDRRLLQIERSRVEPGAGSAGADGGRGGASPSFSAVSLRLKDGRTIRGLAKYEGLFDIGVLGLDGTFHSLSKSQIAQLTREPSIMPRVQASAADMQNLMAFLTRLTTAGTAATGPVPGAPSGASDVANPAVVPFTRISRPLPGEWPTYHGQLSGNRHSPLNEINTTNVSRLSPKWAFPIPGQAQRTLQV